MDAHMIAILVAGAAVLGVVVWVLAKIGQELEPSSPVPLPRQCRH